MSYIKLALVFIAIQFAQTVFADSIFDQPVIMLNVGGESTFALKVGEAEVVHMVHCFATEADSQAVQSRMSGITGAIFIALHVGEQRVIHPENSAQSIAVVCLAAPTQAAP